MDASLFQQKCFVYFFSNPCLYFEDYQADNMTWCVNLKFSVLEKLVLYMLIMVKKGKEDSISGYLSQQMYFFSKV